MMSDAELWREFRKYKQERRAKNLAKADDTGWNKHFMERASLAVTRTLCG